MLYLYINFCNKNPEVMILDYAVLGMGLHFQSNHELYLTLIIFIYHAWIFKKTAQNLLIIFLNL